MAWRPGTFRFVCSTGHRLSILSCPDLKSRPSVYLMARASTSTASTQIQDWRLTVRSFSTVKPETGLKPPLPPPPPPPSSPSASRKVIREESTIASTEVEAGAGTGSTVEKVKKPGLRDMVKKYGLPFFAWYTSLYFGTGIVIYLSIESGLLGIGGAEVLEYVRQTGFSPEMMDKINPAYGSIGVAIVLNECLEIARLPFAIATTPAIIRTWKKLAAKKKTDKPQ